MDTFILGSHDSCANQADFCNNIFNIPWYWAKTQKHSLKDQFNIGVRLFDIRYRYDNKTNTFFISHTFCTSYTLKDALYELLTCAIKEKCYVFINFKRDWKADPCDLGKHVNSLIYCNKDGKSEQLVNYMVTPDAKEAGSNFWTTTSKDPITSKYLVLFSGCNTPILDHFPKYLMHDMLFDTLETWFIDDFEAAVQHVKDMKFKNNGLPKGIWLDWCGYYPPMIANKMIWDKVGEFVLAAIKDKKVQCLNLNGIDIKSMEIIDHVRQDVKEHNIVKEENDTNEVPGKEEELVTLKKDQEMDTSKTVEEMDKSHDVEFDQLNDEDFVLL